MPGATCGGELGAVVDHKAALWLRLELAEGVATVPCCSLGRGYSRAGAGGVTVIGKS